MISNKELMMFVNTIPMAIIYDFDGTLAPGNVQEREFIPKVGMTPASFWEEVNELASLHQADRTLMFMQLMLEKARAVHQPVRRSDFKAMANSVEYYPGVTGWFDDINEYGNKQGVDIKHYIVSSGNAEIIEEVSIASKFDRIYASRYCYDENGVPVWPALAINYTTKTQFLFRINKGALDLDDDSTINQYVPMESRAVPFPQMAYIGDGFNDVPCFRLVKDLGGLSVAVFEPSARAKAAQFIRDKRVESIAPADYTDGSVLDKIIKSRIDLIAAQAKYRDSLVSS